MISFALAYHALPLCLILGFVWRIFFGSLSGLMSAISPSKWG